MRWKQLISHLCSFILTYQSLWSYEYQPWKSWGKCLTCFVSSADGAKEPGVDYTSTVRLTLESLAAQMAVPFEATRWCEDFLHFQPVKSCMWAPGGELAWSILFGAGRWNSWDDDVGVWGKGHRRYLQFVRLEQHMHDFKISKQDGCC